MKFSQLKNLTREIFFLKIIKKNMVEKLFPDPFLKNQT